MPDEAGEYSFSNSPKDNENRIKLKFNLSEITGNTHLVKLYRLHESLGSIMKEAREKGDDDKLDFLEAKLQTELAIELNQSLHHEDDFPDQNTPQLIDTNDILEFDEAWSGIKRGFLEGELKSKDLGRSLNDLYSKKWKDKPKWYMNPAAVKVDKPDPKGTSMLPKADLKKNLQNVSLG